MSNRYRVTPRAFKDLVAISRYSANKWGDARRSAYLSDLERRFRRLAKNPGMGRAREDLGTGYRSYPHGGHIVFYIVREDDIDIIGVPHAAMDLEDYFDVL
jgi:toxin ParE1/3/4